MDYIIKGKVVRGDGYGRKLGFPTVNLEIQRGQTKEFPSEGVYSGTAILGDKKYRAGIVIGPKEVQNKIEAHLLGYSGNAYGELVTLEINKFLRVYIKFNTEQELIDQISKDLEKC